MPADPKDIHHLRHEAEKVLSEAPEKQVLASGTDPKTLVHELFVHQIELEMQNEELRRSQEELEESRREYADLYEFAPVGYLTFDGKGLVTKVNLTATILLGIERSLLLRTPFALLVHPEFQNAFYFHLRSVRQTTTPQTCQLACKRKDGTFFDARLESIGVQVDGSTVIRAILTDVTDVKRSEKEREAAQEVLEEKIAKRTARLRAEIAERKRAELVLQQTLERFYHLLSSMYSGLLLMTDEGRIEFVNQAFCDYYGLEEAPADLVGLASSDLLEKIKHAYLHPDEAAARVSEILKRGQPVRLEEFTMRGGQTAVRDFIPLNVDGKSCGRFWSHTDITARKQIEEELRRSRDELELRVQERTDELSRAYDNLTNEVREREQIVAQLRQAQKMEALGTLTGGIAHDFNNILSVIVGFAELAGDKLKEGSKEKRYFQRVFEAGLRGRDLIKRMLTFARQTEQDKKPLQCSSIVKETTKLLRASISTTISIRTDVRGEPGLVLVDPTQIQQVLMNLCMNAAHAMQERGGVLHVELSDFTVSESDGNPHAMRPGPYIRLMVRDTGTGISPDIIDKIFDPFFTTKEKGEGTGLGLSVVHGIVKQHAGYITVGSEQGKGATFTVYFPAIVEQPKTDAVGEETIPTGHERILFVDDEEALAEMGEAILTGLGYEVLSKTSSREALALFKLDPSRFDLVITDGTMPELTGFQLAKEITAIRRDIPIILCTGFGQLVKAGTAKAAGIKALSMKPVTKREIARTIRQVLDG